jgi:hypothetical protein
MSPQPVPLPQTVDERLAFAAHHRGVATLGPEQAAALLLRLAELEAIAQRAREVRDAALRPIESCEEWSSAYAEAEVAKRILGEDG